MPESRPLRVFLCHASQDKPKVRELYKRLKSESWIDPWLDEEKLLPGMNWDLEIQKALHIADLIIVCLSSESIAKEGYVQKEFKRALSYAEEKPDGTIYIIPLRLNECMPPIKFQQWQWVDYFSGNIDAYVRLLTSLRLKGISIGIIFPNSTSVSKKESLEKIEKPVEVKGIYSNSLPLDKQLLRKMVTTMNYHNISIAQAIIQNLSFLPRQNIAPLSKINNKNITALELDEFLGGFYLVLLVALFGFLAMKEGIVSAEQELSRTGFSETFKIVIRSNLSKAVDLIREDISAGKLMLTLQYDLFVSKSMPENEGVASAVDTFLTYYLAYVDYENDN